MTYGVQSFHSDYMSGWDEAELQRLLDTCENESEAANPDAFCSDHLTYRGKAKTEGVQVERHHNNTIDMKRMNNTTTMTIMQVEDDVIRSDLEKIQPVPAIDTLATISPEQVDNVSSPPRTACSGTLLAYTNPTVTGKLNNNSFSA